MYYQLVIKVSIVLLIQQQTLNIYEKEKMLVISSNEIEIINNGAQFANLIASEFDTYISGS